MSKTIEETAKRRSWAESHFGDRNLSNAELDCATYMPSENFSDGWDKGMEYFISLPLASRLTPAEKERVRKEYFNTYPLDPDCGVANILIQGVLERIFGADFFKEDKI